MHDFDLNVNGVAYGTRDNPSDSQLTALELNRIDRRGTESPRILELTPIFRHRFISVTGSIPRHDKNRPKKTKVNLLKVATNDDYVPPIMSICEL